MIEYLIVAGVSAVLSLFGGGYLGYKYGRRVEVKAREAYEAVEAQVKAKLG
jgi:hypothetical protein